MDDLDRVIEEGAATAVAPRPTVVPVAVVLSSIVPLRIAATNALAAAPGIDIARATPEEREELVLLYSELGKLASPVKTLMAAIESGFKRAAIEAGANMVGLEGKRVVKFSPPRADYQVKEKELREALIALTKEVALPPAMIDEAVWQEVAFHVNHARLNYLADHFGEKVAEAIDKYRTKPPVPLMGGKVTIPPPA